MSTIRTIWSDCSRDLKKLYYRKQCFRNHMRLKSLDDAFNYSCYHDCGKEWTIKTRCEIFLLDMDTNVVSLFNIAYLSMNTSRNRHWKTHFLLLIPRIRYSLINLFFQTLLHIQEKMSEHACFFMNHHILSSKIKMVTV